MASKSAIRHSKSRTCPPMQTASCRARSAGCPALRAPRNAGARRAAAPRSFQALPDLEPEAVFVGEADAVKPLRSKRDSPLASRGRHQLRTNRVALERRNSDAAPAGETTDKGDQANNSENENDECDHGVPLPAPCYPETPVTRIPALWRRSRCGSGLGWQGRRALWTRIVSSNAEVLKPWRQARSAGNEEVSTRWLRRRCTL